ncbi:MAG: hypothetical protein JXB38_04885, partial [Anaerolineales bacterium]|nr:hypothetical protein [Anaerolineales bacterium]
HSLSLAPYEANYRIALLLDFENATDSAQNALLKTLEEPPGRVIMLLTAESAEVLLPTIVSRCEVLRLRPVSLQDMVQGLSDDFDIPEYQISLLAHVSGGRPGYAVWLSQNPEALEQRKDWLDEHQRLLTSGRVKRFAFVDEIGLSGRDPDKRRQRVAEFEQMLQVWLVFWRDVLLKAAAANAPLANPDREVEIETLAQHLGLPAVRAVVSNLEHTLSLLRTNANTRLVAEVLMLDLPMLS